MVFDGFFVIDGESGVHVTDDGANGGGDAEEESGSEVVKRGDEKRWNRSQH